MKKSSRHYPAYNASRLGRTLRARGIGCWNLFRFAHRNLVVILSERRVPPGSLTFSPLKMDGWKMSFLLGFGLFSGAMLNFGEVRGVQSQVSFFFLFRKRNMFKPLRRRKKPRKQRAGQGFCLFYCMGEIFQRPKRASLWKGKLPATL